MLRAPDAYTTVLHCRLRTDSLRRFVAGCLTSAQTISPNRQARDRAAIEENTPPS